MKLSSVYSVVFGVPLIATQTLAQSLMGWYGGDVHCGDKIMVSTKLQHDLDCDCSNGPAVVIDGQGVIFDLNGHKIDCDYFGESQSDWFEVGIKVKGKDNCVFGPGEIDDTATGIVLAGEGGHTVERVSIYDSSDQAIRIAGTNNNIVRYNFIKGAYYSGIGLYGRWNTVSYNNIKYVGPPPLTATESSATESLSPSSGAGIEVEGGRGNVMERNLIFDTYFGVALYDTIHNFFTDNYVFDQFQSFVHMYDCEHIEVKDNTFIYNRFGGDYPGLYISNSDVIEIVNNHVAKVDGHGIKLRSNSYHVVVKDNIFEYVDDRGIQCYSASHAKIIGNTIHDTGSKGIYLDDDCDDPVVRGNSITQPDSCYGLKVEDGVSNGAVISNVVDQGIDDDASGTVLIDNETSGSCLNGDEEEKEEDVELVYKTRGGSYFSDSDKDEPTDYSDYPATD